jgi:hypothetical protein
LQQYHPESDQIAALRQPTLRAKRDREQLQQIFKAKSQNRMKGVDKETFSN